MTIHTRKPPSGKNRTLINASGIGVLKLNDKQHIDTSIITASGKTLGLSQAKHLSQSESKQGTSNANHS